ncbi:unnamed protein product [Closterium sp. Naga37s-1]|nr:unnamed protein product [Closterium sp. Naga37s-1]
MHPTDSQLGNVPEDPFAQLTLDPLADVSSFDADVAVPEGAAPRPAGRRLLCDRCQRPSRACLCPSLPPSRLKTRTRVIVVQHPHEAKKRLATAPILALTLESTRIITGRRFLEGSSAELDRVLIPRCGNRLDATWQDGRGEGETEAVRGGEENGQCEKEDRERGNGFNDGSEPLKRETAGIGSGNADSGPTGDGVCEARICGASGAGDGVCACGHVRLLMFPGEGALPVGDWWRWYLARRQLDAQHPGERGVEQHGVEQHGEERHGVEKHGVEQHGVEQHGVEQHGVEQHGVEQHGVEQHGVEQHGVEQHGVEQHGVEQHGVEQHGVEQHGVEGHWRVGMQQQGWLKETMYGEAEPACAAGDNRVERGEMMKASGSFLRRYCSMVCLPFDRASPGPPPGHLGLVGMIVVHGQAFPCRGAAGSCVGIAGGLITKGFVDVFSIGLSTIIIYAGVVPFYAQTYINGGPVALVWYWWLTALFTHCVALTFAEVSSSFPISGSLYFWAAALAGPKHGPFAAWITVSARFPISTAHSHPPLAAWITVSAPLHRSALDPLPLLAWITVSAPLPRSALDPLPLFAWITVSVLSTLVPLIHPHGYPPHPFKRFSNQTLTFSSFFLTTPAPLPFHSPSSPPPLNPMHPQGWLEFFGISVGLGGVAFGGVQLLQYTIYAATGGANNGGYFLSNYECFGITAGVLIMGGLLTSLPIKAIGRINVFTAVWQVRGSFRSPHPVRSILFPPSRINPVPTIPMPPSRSPIRFSPSHSPYRIPPPVHHPTRFPHRIPPISPPPNPPIVLLPCVAVTAQLALTIKILSSPPLPTSPPRPPSTPLFAQIVLTLAIIVLLPCVAVTIRPTLLHRNPLLSRCLTLPPLLQPPGPAHPLVCPDSAHTRDHRVATVCCCHHSIHSFIATHCLRDVPPFSLSSNPPALPTLLCAQIVLTLVIIVLLPCVAVTTQPASFVFTHYHAQLDQSHLPNAVSSVTTVHRTASHWLDPYALRFCSAPHRTALSPPASLLCLHALPCEDCSAPHGNALHPYASSHCTALHSSVSAFLSSTLPFPQPRPTLHPSPHQAYAFVVARQLSLFGFQNISLCPPSLSSPPLPPPGIRLGGGPATLPQRPATAATTLHVIYEAAIEPSQNPPPTLPHQAYAFVVALQLSLYGQYSYDTVAHMAEETKHADRTIPLAMVSSLSCVCVLGWGLLVSLTFCIENDDRLLGANNETRGEYPVVQIIWDVFFSRYGSGTGAIIILCCMSLAFFLGVVGGLTGASRAARSLALKGATGDGPMGVDGYARAYKAYPLSRNSGPPFASLWRRAYSLSRDSGLPFAWRRVNRDRTPIYAVWLCCGISILFSLPLLFPLYPSPHQAYSLSRDSGLPFASLWRRVNRDRTPIYAVWLCCGISILFALPLLDDSSTFHFITSLATVTWVGSYLVPIFFRLVQRDEDFEPGAFSLANYVGHTGRSVPLLTALPLLDDSSTFHFITSLATVAWVGSYSVPIFFRLIQKDEDFEPGAFNLANYVGHTGSLYLFPHRTYPPTQIQTPVINLASLLFVIYTIATFLVTLSYIYPHTLSPLPTQPLPNPGD